MSVRNRLLLSLLGANFDGESDEGLEGDATSADWLLAGMYLAKIRKPDALCPISFRPRIPWMCHRCHVGASSSA